MFPSTELHAVSVASFSTNIERRRKKEGQQRMADQIDQNNSPGLSEKSKFTGNEVKVSSMITIELWASALTSWNKKMNPGGCLFWGILRFALSLCLVCCDIKFVGIHWASQLPCCPYGSAQVTSCQGRSTREGMVLYPNSSSRPKAPLDHVLFGCSWAFKVWLARLGKGIQSVWSIIELVGWINQDMQSLLGLKSWLGSCHSLRSNQFCNYVTCRLQRGNSDMKSHCGLYQETHARPKETQEPIEHQNYNKCLGTAGENHNPRPYATQTAWSNFQLIQLK